MAEFYYKDDKNMWNKLKGATGEIQIEMPWWLYEYHNINKGIGPFYFYSNKEFITNPFLTKIKEVSKEELPDEYKKRGE